MPGSLLFADLIDSYILMNNKLPASSLTGFNYSEKLLWYFSANNNWKVTIENGAIIAIARPSNPIWETVKLDEFEQLQITVQMTPMTKGKLHFRAMSFIDYTQNIATYPIVVFKDTDGRTFISTIICKVNTLFIQIIETSFSSERKYTSSIIDSIVKEIANVLKDSNNQGDYYSINLLPKNSYILSQKNSLEIEKTKGYEYKIFGYVNTGQAGYIYINTINTQTGAILQAEKNKIRTLEYVGWSKDMGRKFYFESEIAIDGDKSTLPIKFQVIFYPLNGEVILEKTLDIKTWMK